MTTYNKTLGTRKGLAPEEFISGSMHVVDTAEATAVVKGGVMQLDHNWVSSETTNSTAGETGSAYVNLIDVDTVDLDTGTFMAATEAVAKGADGEFALKGRVQVLVNNTTGGNLTGGTLLGPVVDEQYLSDAPAIGTKWVARLDETSPTTDSGTTLRWCWFDGE